MLKTRRKVWSFSNPGPRGINFYAPEEADPGVNDDDTRQEIQGESEAEEGQFDDAPEFPTTTTLPQIELMNTNTRNQYILFNHNLHVDHKKKTKLDPSSQESQDFSNDDEDYDFDDDDDGDDYEMYGDKIIGPNSQQSVKSSCPEELLKKYSNKINVDKYEGLHLQSEAATKLLSSNKKIESSRYKQKDKKDRATVEQVMDPRTRMILYKLMSSEKITSIDGCISTGKEANVYHATGGPALHSLPLAIKIFKTSILTFKARDKYVTGEFRFRGGYCKKNPRKMVALWAEKEYRNLLRIYSSAAASDADGVKILVPKPILLKSHVLVMSFIGHDGWPSPLLKDVKFDTVLPDNVKEALKKEEGETPNSEQDQDDEKYNKILLNKLYKDSLLILYRLYKHCKLVHADFSEFNLILQDWLNLYVIDVSQSVEHDHPRSLDFLKSDIKNVQDFFGKRGILIGGYKELFNWITSPSMTDANYEAELHKILQGGQELCLALEKHAVDDEVFRQSYIPTKMIDVVHYERDFKAAQRGTELVYTNLLGMKPDLSGPQLTTANAANTDNVEVKINQEQSMAEEDMKDVGKATRTHDNDDGSSSSEESSSSGAGEEDSKFHNSARPRNETAEEKRNRKKAVKEEKAGKRETKMKKHIKKRKEKLSHANSKRK